MYAIFEDGSRQYRVSEGQIVAVDFRATEKGNEVVFDRVLLTVDGNSAKVGQPTVAGAKVIGEVVEQTKTKTRIQKFRRRKNYKRLKGHTQPMTRVKIKSISV
jgi:large subunit ribosomal protein L21